MKVLGNAVLKVERKFQISLMIMMLSQHLFRQNIVSYPLVFIFKKFRKKVEISHPHIYTGVQRVKTSF